VWRGTYRLPVTRKMGEKGKMGRRESKNKNKINKK
jgi:hypothetical protein